MSGILNSLTKVLGIFGGSAKDKPVPAAQVTDPHEAEIEEEAVPVQEAVAAKQ
jgi:hypothetical protein